MRCTSFGLTWYLWRRWLLRRPAITIAKAARALSASELTISNLAAGSCVKSPPDLTSSACISLSPFEGNFHTRRKASPIFLFALPSWRATSRCTIFAIELTNSMTPSWRISVVSVNWRMSQNPKIANTFLPGTMGLRSPACFMFSAIISAPASPNPTAMRLQIFVMEFSRIRVSNSSSWPSLSSTWSLLRGFSLTSLTFFIMRSIGSSTRLLASLEKSMAPAPRMIHMKMVRQKLRTACFSLSHRRLSLILEFLYE
mmetsp:Transcript_67149/g.212596  ORF Transcript_67149/g.212596 Transcript_67149/m.212596 type:complete len:256 (+) Transcript_67149:807-1574(+)